MRDININDPVSCILPQSARNDEPINMPVTVFTVSSYNGVNTVSVTLSAHHNFHGGTKRKRIVFPKHSKLESLYGNCLCSSGKPPKLCKMRLEVVGTGRCV